MRIIISGTQSSGKSTLIEDFLKEWASYTTPKETYRDILKTKNYPRNKECNKEGQWAVLNHMVDELQKYSKDDNVIFDRCPLDNLIYSMYAFEKGTSDIDKEFIDKCIPIVRESMKAIDVIFFIPLSKTSPVPIVKDGLRDIDPEYRDEIDALFKGMFHQYRFNLGRTPFFPADDCPAIIEIFGNRHERIALLQQYLDVSGDVIGDDETSILNPDNINDLEKLLKEQMTEIELAKLEATQKKLTEEFDKKNRKRR